MMFSIVAILGLTTLVLLVLAGLALFGLAKFLETCDSDKKDASSKAVEEKKENPVLVPAIYDKFDLFGKLSKVLENSTDCPIRAWSIWEIDDMDAYNNEFSGLSSHNKIIAYCSTQDEICSALMDASLSHDIVAFKLTKSNGHTWSILGIGVVSTKGNETNIDADIIESVVNVVKDPIDENATLDDKVAHVFQRMSI